MHLVPHDLPPQFRRFEPNWSVYPDGGPSPFSTDGFKFDILRRPIDEVKVGHTVYPLRTPSQTTFCPGPPGQNGEFLVEKFPEIVGHGRTWDEAQRDWKFNLHAHVQDLLTKRPFEMSEAEV